MIHILFTGGTISMQRDAAAGGNVPAHSGEALLRLAPGIERIAQVRIEDWARMPACHFDQARLWALRERVRAFAAIGHQRMETERFHEFCQRHLAHLDDVALEFFTSDAARNAVRAKVASLYPPHEVESFTELFWERIGRWRADYQRQRVPPSHRAGKPPRAAAPR